MVCWDIFMKLYSWSAHSRIRVQISYRILFAPLYTPLIKICHMCIVFNSYIIYSIFLLQLSKINKISNNPNPPTGHPPHPTNHTTSPSPPSSTFAGTTRRRLPTSSTAPSHHQVATHHRWSLNTRS